MTGWKYLQKQKKIELKKLNTGYHRKRAFLLVGCAVEPAQIALSADHIGTREALAGRGRGARITGILIGPTKRSPIAAALAVGFAHTRGADVVNKRPKPTVFIWAMTDETRYF